MGKQAFLCRVIVGAGLTTMLSIASAAEPIANLARIDGVAVVSQGAQYVKGREGMNLKEGDRLMALEGGNAVIEFKDGCRYTLADNELLTIGTKSTCATDAVGSYKVDPYGGVSQTPTAAAENFRYAALEAPAGGTVAAAGLGWVPLAAAGFVGLAGVATNSETKGSSGNTGITQPPVSP
ncbi:MAG: hypothetical protein U9Q81_11995 [Pseudomonadota bacterium]|nr:hypothetical protein [Pseudomonadota bacterium]